MGTGVDIGEIKNLIGSRLGDGAKDELLLLVEIVQRFHGFDIGALREAVYLILRSSYVSTGDDWRNPQSSSELRDVIDRWRSESSRRRNRILQQVQSGRPLDRINQFELATWVEDATKEHETETVKILFPLLNRDRFSDERWFELERCFGDAQIALQQLLDEISDLEKEAEELRTKLKAIEQGIQQRKDKLGLPSKHRSRITRGNRTRTRTARKYTGIVIRVGGYEGAINSVIRSLGLISGNNGVNSERGIKLLLNSGHKVEITKGNAAVPTGTVLSELVDITR